MRLITFLNFKVYLTSYHQVKYYRSKNILIYPEVPFKLFSTLYFTFLCFRYKKVVIHIKKRSTILFDILKIIFPRKLNYIYEGEGDPLTEAEYLSQHIYKKTFYDNDIKNLKIAAGQQKSVFHKADLITFGYLPMKNMLINRYPDMNLEEKIVLVPMTFSRGKMYYSDDVRSKIRKKHNISNKVVFTYIGNVYYSWQNLYRSLQIFLLIKKQLKRDAHIILLIKKADHEIANDFISRLGIGKSDYLLTTVDHDMIPAYLNAADIGLVLRHNHILNLTTPPGKILDYLGCGLPVITTAALGELSQIVAKNNFGVVLDDMYCDKEILDKVSPLLSIDNARRNFISEWANKNLSMENNINSYIDRVKGL